MPAKGQKVSVATRERMSKGMRRSIARRRQLALVLPSDLAHLKAAHESGSGIVAEALLPFFTAAALEGEALLLGYEGKPGEPGYRPLSAPKRALLDDYLRAGFIMRGEFSRYAQTADADAGSRAISAMGRRAALLERLGFGRVANELDVTEYVAKHDAEDRVGETIAAEPERSPAPAGATATTPIASGVPEPTRSGTTETKGGT